MAIHTDVGEIIRKLQHNPFLFFETSQTESLILEYKTAYLLDSAIDLCPFSDPQKKPLNPALELRILETLVAFANTKGGVLILGVSEEKGKIVDEGAIKRCFDIKGNAEINTRCFDAVSCKESFKIGELRIIGLNRELEVLEMDFDAFKRRVIDRFTFRPGQKKIRFKPAVYPCMAVENQHQKEIQVVMSEGIDTCIEEIHPVILMNKNNEEILLGAVVVNPSQRPIYMTMQERDSKNVLCVLPVRKTGKTELEKDLARVQSYISDRFGQSLAEKIAEKLKELSAGKWQQFGEVISEKTVFSVAEKEAAAWVSAGCPYGMVQEIGESLKTFTQKMDLWNNVTDEELCSFLFMISLHFNAGWEIWSKRVVNNRLAVKGLFEVFHFNYWRTRFRALYALQFLNPELIIEELERDSHHTISDKTRQIIQTRVPEKNIADLIKKIAESDMGDISKKAGSVLIEISTLWNDPAAGMSSPL